MIAVPILVAFLIGLTLGYVVRDREEKGMF